MTNNERAKASCLLAGFSQEDLHKALITMGKKHVKGAKLKAQWSVSNPTRNYCYVVSEVVFWYLSPEGSKAMGLRIAGEEALHRFVQWPEGVNVDCTCDQFPESAKLDYEAARHRPFLQTGCKGPSKRAIMLAKLLGVYK